MNNKEFKKKKLNHLLSLGSLMIGNEGLIDLTIELREKYKINIKEKEWNPGYIERLEEDGTKEKIREDIKEYFSNLQAEGQSSNIIDRCLALVAQSRDEKIKDAWSAAAPLIFEVIGKIVDGMGEMTVGQFLDKFGLNMFAGEIFTDEFTEYVITDELQAFPPGYLSAVVTELPDIVIAVASPLTIQEEIIDQFKKDMRKKFPASSKTLDDRLAAACYVYHKMKKSNKDIARRVYDIDPNRKDYDAELSRKANIVSKKIKKIKRQIEQRL